MKSIYHIVTHPNLRNSRVNKVVIGALKDKPGVVTQVLYDAYPDRNINVKNEQKNLLSADIVVVQTPFYWYSTPSLFKEWEDKVLEYGFAYGEGGDKLKGKEFLMVLSAFGPEEAYRHTGYNRFTIRELLSPIEQTANLCGMRFLEPLALLGVAKKTDQEIHDFTNHVANEIERLRK